MKKPDSYYLDLAREALEVGPRTVAERRSLPLTTVHRAVKEARCRGLIPPPFVAARCPTCGASPSRQKVKGAQ